MSEIDLRKMPMHRKMEAYEEISLKYFQRLYEQGNLTPNTIKLTRDDVWDDMGSFEVDQDKGMLCWMDFGNKFLIKKGLIKNE